MASCFLFQLHNAHGRNQLEQSWALSDIIYLNCVFKDQFNVVELM